MSKKLILLSLFSTSIIYLNAAQKMQYQAYVSHCNQKNQDNTHLQTTCCKLIDGGSWYGLYSGHDGNQVAAYLENHLHTLFSQSQGTIQQKFDAAFKTASIFCRRNYINPDGYHPGASASVVFIKDNVAHVAHVGSCHTLIMNDHHIFFDTTPHNGYNPKERERINNLIPQDTTAGMIPEDHFNAYGHFIYNGTGWRVTRSIGDDNQKHVICTPEYCEYELRNNPTCILLATDSFIKKCDPTRADRINKTLPDRHDMAKEIAGCKNSNDVTHFGKKYPHEYENQTIIVIDLGNKILYIPWWKNNINSLFAAGGICVIIFGVLMKKYYR